MHRLNDAPAEHVGARSACCSRLTRNVCALRVHLAQGIVCGSCAVSSQKVTDPEVNTSPKTCCLCTLRVFEDGFVGAAETFGVCVFIERCAEDASGCIVGWINVLAGIVFA